MNIIIEIIFVRYFLRTVFGKMVANGNKTEFTRIELEMCRKEKLGKLNTNWMKAITFFYF